MRDFVDQGSIVRNIWSNADAILLIFAGSAAEFALNKAVDWLFFTGKLPRDPIGRFFATVGFAQDIVFADEATAYETLERIVAIHRAVERRRGQRIPDWAHRDVLFMLIDYSERAYQLLARSLTEDEQNDLYDVFRRVGAGLQIPDLPASYAEWQVARQEHLQNDLEYSDGTRQLYEQYRRQLGLGRFLLLRQIQGLLVPPMVRQLLGLQVSPLTPPMLEAYRLVALVGLRPIIQRLLIESRYLPNVRQLDRAAAE